MDGAVVTGTEDSQPARDVAEALTWFQADPEKVSLVDSEGRWYFGAEKHAATIVRAALAAGSDDVVHDAIPEQVPGPLAQVAEDLLRPLAQRVADDPQVVQGWSDTADEARRAWLAQLEDPQGADEPGSGADVTIPFGPVAQSGITAALGDIERDLREDRFDLPGQALLETIMGADRRDPDGPARDRGRLGDVGRARLGTRPRGRDLR